MDLGLTNKVAMVGGASKGLGFAVAKALAAEGAHVVIAARDEDAIERAAATINAGTGGRALPVRADLSKADAITRWHVRRPMNSAASICSSRTPAVRRPAPRSASTTWRGTARSICCCSA